MVILQYSDLTAAALNLALLVTVAGLVQRAGWWRAPVAWGVMIYFSLRVASRLNDAPTFLFDSSPRVEVALDVASVVVLAFLVTRVQRLRQLVGLIVDEARFRAEEYERARAHYTQVVRHRMMNPLTVIEGASETLETVELDPELHAKMCRMIRNSAAELREVSLEPERRDDLERNLNAVPELRRRTGT